MYGNWGKEVLTKKTSNTEVSFALSVLGHCYWAESRIVDHGVGVQVLNLVSRLQARESSIDAQCIRSAPIRRELLLTPTGISGGIAG